LEQSSPASSASGSTPGTARCSSDNQFTFTPQSLKAMADKQQAVQLKRQLDKKKVRAGLAA